VREKNKRRSPNEGKTEFPPGTTCDSGGAREDEKGVLDKKKKKKKQRMRKGVRKAKRGYGEHKTGHFTGKKGNGKREETLVS